MTIEMASIMCGDVSYGESKHVKEETDVGTVVENTAIPSRKQSQRLKKV